jgi:hypothetical protein
MSLHLCLLLVLAKGPASLEDLELLERQQAHVELLERAEDVPTAARTDAWKDLVANAAIRAIQSTRIGIGPFEQAASADALLKRFTVLRQRPAFATAREETVLAGLRKCIGSKEVACLDTLAWEKSLSPTASLAVGKSLRRNGAPAVRPIQLFSRAVGAKDAPACKDPDVAEAAIAALDSSGGSETARAGRQIAFEWCWSALQPKLREAMVGASSLRLMNACKPMRAKNALTELQAELCTEAGL